MLEVLLLRRGRVVSKAQIQEHLCDWDEALTDGAIELYVHRLRKKLEGTEVELRTVRGFGYLLQADALARSKPFWRKALRVCADACCGCC